MLGIQALGRIGENVVSRFRDTAAKPFRRRVNQGATAQSVSGVTAEDRALAAAVNAEITGRECSNAALRDLLANSSSRLADQSSYYCGMMNRLARDTIGRMPRLMLSMENEADNESVEDRFHEWAGKVKLGKKLRKMRRLAAIKGEAFLVLVNNPAIKPVQLDVRVIDRSRVTGGSEQDLTNPFSIDGIDFDSDMNAIRYWILDEVPSRLQYADYQPKPIPAKNVIHYFRDTREEQYRGIPEATPALMLFPQVQRYSKAVLTAAETAARTVMALSVDGVWLEKADEAGETIEPPIAGETFNVDYGSILTLPESTELQAIKPEQPTTVYDQFVRAMVCEAARCIDMPAILALGCSDGSSFAGANVDWHPWENTIHQDRTDIDADALFPILSRWFEEAVLIEDYLPLVARQKYSMDGLPGRWGYDRLRKHIDPDKESKGAERFLQNGLMIHDDFYADGGISARRQLERQARLFGKDPQEFMDALFDRIYRSEQVMAAEVMAESDDDGEASGEKREARKAKSKAGGKKLAVGVADGS